MIMVRLFIHLVFILLCIAVVYFVAPFVPSEFQVVFFLCSVLLGVIGNFVANIVCDIFE
jgi:hypothetical protein